MASINALVLSSRGRTYVGRICVLAWPSRWATVNRVAWYKFARLANVALRS